MSEGDRYGGWGPCGRMLYHRKVVVLTMRQYVLRTTGTGNAIGGDSNVSGPTGVRAHHMSSCLGSEEVSTTVVRPCHKPVKPRSLGALIRMFYESVRGPDPPTSGPDMLVQ